MDTNDYISTRHRLAALTYCPDGYNDLRPALVEPAASSLDFYADHYAHSHYTPPAVGATWPAWCPGYMENNQLRADLIVFDLHGCSADHAHRSMIENNLAAFVHPTKSDSLTSPRCRLVILLNRPVNAPTYRLLWARMAREVFDNIPVPAHADCRHRFDYPRTVKGKSMMRHHDGNSLHVDGVLALASLAGPALGLVNDTHADALSSELTFLHSA